MNTANNKVQMLHDLLKKEIEAGTYKQGEKLPSVRDMAVSYNLNKSTAVAALATLANEGLVRTEAGRGAFVLGKREPKQIAMLYYADAAPFRVETEILRHLHKSIGEDYFLSLHDTTQNYPVFQEKIASLVQSGVKGIIAIPPKNYIPTQEDVDVLNEIISDRVPLIFVIRNIEGVNADYYSMNLNVGIQKAVAHLATSGKRCIALIEHDSRKFIEEELAGMETACRNLGIQMNPDYILQYDYNDLEVLRQKLKKILDEIDAIIAPDNLLCSLQELLRNSGKSIPGELSVVGINDVVSPFFYPPLTSIHFPVEAIGSSAMNTMMMRIEKNMPPEKIRRNFAPELIIRET